MTAAPSFHRHRMLLCQLVQRQLRFLFGQGKTDDDVLAPELAPEAFRRPFLRLGAARSFDPDEIPLRHESVPRKSLKTWKFAKLPPVGNAVRGQEKIGCGGKI